MFPTRNPELKITLTQAGDEAREHGHREIGPDHLLVAMLTNVRGRTFRILSDHGLEYASASERLVAFHEAQPEQPGEDGLDRDRDALNSIGIDLDAVRDAMQKHFGIDVTQEWGGRDTGRDRRRGGHRGHRGHRGGDGMGGGRRGPRGRGRRPAFSASLKTIAEDMREGMRDHFESAGRAGAHDVMQDLPVRTLIAILRSDDPALDAVLGDVDRQALLSAAEASVAVTA
ncbi:Clp protease N-terminal domain-containing protein [Demetria terragena]|uniref:Clp protease N-terminal domain-containing protein n=1 Tax=Demetria terragena TaxID=63959 RepID=UPI000375D6A2|nr:Clp protease N-terminal domain-containing protein [Demetria terragena]